MDFHLKIVSFCSVKYAVYCIGMFTKSHVFIFVPFSVNEKDLVIEPEQPKQKNKGDKGNQGEGEKVVKPSDKEQKSQPVVSEDYTDEYEGGSSGHFMAYFLTATVLCVAGYVIFHNKQKVSSVIQVWRIFYDSVRKQSFISSPQNQMSHVARKPVFGVSDLVQLKLGC